MDKRLLDILCCPVSRQPLRLLTRAELDQVNHAAANSSLIHADGSVWNEKIAAALVTRDGRLIYRVEDDIPVMLADLSIATDGLPGFASANS